MPHENEATADLREGMEHTLTLLNLSVSRVVPFLIATNAIEGPIGFPHRTSRNATRWRLGEMISRWTALGLLPRRTVLSAH